MVKRYVKPKHGSMLYRHVYSWDERKKTRGGEVTVYRGSALSELLSSMSASPTSGSTVSFT